MNHASQVFTAQPLTDAVNQAVAETPNCEGMFLVLVIVHAYAAISSLQSVHVCHPNVCIFSAISLFLCSVCCHPFCHLFCYHPLALTAPTVTPPAAVPCRWITTEDKLALEDPSLFCDACYTMLHLDQEGGKLYMYKAFPFVEVVTPDMLQRNQLEQSGAELESALVT